MTFRHPATDRPFFCKRAACRQYHTNTNKVRNEDKERPRLLVHQQVSIRADAGNYWVCLAVAQRPLLMRIPIFSRIKAWLESPWQLVGQGQAGWVADLLAMFPRWMELYFAIKLF